MGDGRWVWALVIVAVVAGLLLALRRRPAPPAVPEDPNAFMPLLADEAVLRARTEFGVALDFGPDSVASVEEALDKLHARRAAGAMTDGRLNREAMTWGAYVGEVIRRLKGGRWAKDHHAAGPDSYPIDYDGHQSFPVGWCGRRILNGAEDSVLHKFRFLVLG
ncbi:unnamed protein product, partial [Phaeothamnion confervicola]